MADVSSRPVNPLPSTKGEPPWAYFDVDGTLINTRSLLGFLSQLEHGPWMSAERFQRYWQGMRALLAGPTSREDLNRHYYGIFAGLTPSLIDDLGRRWVAQASLRAGFWRDDTVTCLQRHRLKGTRICLVTGSFRGVVWPMAQLLGADEILCSQPEVEEGRFTGRLSGRPCIGEGKAEAVRDHAERHGIDLRHCVAYGDDETDRPMLDMMGHGVMLMPGPAYQQEIAKAFQPDGSLTARGAAV